MFSEYNFKNFNFRLLFYALALNAIGLLVINSAVNGDRSYINRQLIGLFGGLCPRGSLSCLSSYA